MADFEHLHLAATSRRRALEELMLLSDHVRVAADRCPRCIKKHALLADAYAREALLLTGAGPEDEYLANAAAVILAMVDAGNLDTAPEMIRGLRLDLEG